MSATAAVLLLVCVVAASCSKERVLEYNPDFATAIGFSVESGWLQQSVGTKSTAVTDEQGLQGHGFSVLDLTVSDGDGGQPDAVLMFNQDVDYADSQWSYTPVKYWPNWAPGYYWSRALSPKVSTLQDAGQLQVEGDEGAASYTYTAPAVNPLTATPDLLEALFEYDADYTEDDGNGGTMTYADFGRFYGRRPIPFAFRHLLSCIRFDARMKESYETATLKEFEVTGNFNASGALNTTRGQFGWNALGSPQETLYPLLPSSTKPAKAQVDVLSDTDEVDLTRGEDNDLIMAMPTLNAQSGVEDIEVYVKYTLSIRLEEDGEEVLIPRCDDQGEPIEYEASFRIAMDFYTGTYYTFTLVLGDPCLMMIRSSSPGIYGSMWSFITPSAGSYDKRWPGYFVGTPGRYDGQVWVGFMFGTPGFYLAGGFPGSIGGGSGFYGDPGFPGYVGGLPGDYVFGGYPEFMYGTPGDYGAGGYPDYLDGLAGDYGDGGFPNYLDGTPGDYGDGGSPDYTDGQAGSYGSVPQNPWAEGDAGSYRGWWFPYYPVGSPGHYSSAGSGSDAGRYGAGGTYGAGAE